MYIYIYILTRGSKCNENTCKEYKQNMLWSKFVSIKDVSKRHRE